MESNGIESIKMRSNHLNIYNVVYYIVVISYVRYFI